jgi:hypothetical protein
MAGSAHGEGWSWGDLNPLAKLPTPKPKLSWPTPPAVRPPAPVRKFGRDTKRLLSTTWRTVTFQSNRSSGDARTSNWERGSSNARRRAAEQRNSSWFGSLFKPETPRPIKTANEFLKLARPEP